MESSGEASGPAAGAWDAGRWAWDAAVVASVQGAWGGRDVTGSERSALAPLRWHEVGKSVWGSSQLPCRGFAPCLPCVVLLTLPGVSRAGGVQPPGRPPSSIPAAKLRVATEAPAKEERFPLVLVGFSFSVGRGCGSWAASSTWPGSWSPWLSVCRLAAKGSERQPRVVRSLADEKRTLGTDLVGIAVISRCPNTLQKLRN